MNFLAISSSVLILIGTLLLFMLFQRWLQRELQRVFLLLTRSPNAALVVFSVLFFPGVFLHESSHFLMARLLGVRTGRFSLLPRKLPNHRLQLGYVETARSDVLREAIIGAAPLILGGLTITWIGVSILGMSDLGTLLRQAQWDPLFQKIIQLPSIPDFWLWFYLCFTVSSTMLPSPSDRQAWIPLAGILVLLVGAAFIAGVGPWLSTNLAPFFGNIISVLSLVFVLGLFIHAILLIPVWLFRVLLQNLIPL